MQACRELYEADGFVLVDTSKNQPFDYLARKRTSTRRIEVKGTTGGLGKVTITSGELLAVRNDDITTDLFVLFDIRLVEVQPGEFRAEGGRAHCERNWAPKDNQLKATQYEYTFSSEAGCPVGPLAKSARVNG